MARALNLQHPTSTPELDQLARYSQEELDLRARVVRRTQKPPPPALERLFELRRAGASRQVLLAFASQELSSPILLHVAVREWIAEE